MPLAYVFWHAPAGDADLSAYEARVRDFHAALVVTGSRTFRLERAPYEAAPPRLYRLLQGNPEDTVAEARWLVKPAGVSYPSFHEELAATVPGATVWQRQMVLGPAPEYAVLTTAPVTLPWRSVATGPQPL